MKKLLLRISICLVLAVCFLTQSLYADKDITSAVRRSRANAELRKRVAELKKELNQKVRQCARRSDNSLGRVLAGFCKNQCGDGKCAEIVCTAEGCPCPESHETCPADCPA